MATNRVLLNIEGMTCDGCAETIKRHLKRDRGVRTVEIDWKAGVGVLTFDPEVTDEEKILGSPAFRRHYKATAVPPGSCC